MPLLQASTYRGDAVTMTDSTPAKRRTRGARSAPLDYAQLPDCALVRERYLLPIVPFSSPTLWRKVKAGTFPAPVRLDSGRMTAWRWGDVREWLDAQVRKEAA